MIHKLPVLKISQWPPAANPMTKVAIVEEGNNRTFLLDVPLYAAKLICQCVNACAEQQGKMNAMGETFYRSGPA